SLDILHYQIVRADIVKLADMRMVQRSDCPGFALESFAELLTRSLDGDDAIEPCVACLPHYTHSARADLRADVIPSQMCAGLDDGHFSAQFTLGRLTSARNLKT